MGRPPLRPGLPPSAGQTEQFPLLDFDDPDRPAPGSTADRHGYPTGEFSPNFSADRVEEFFGEDFYGRPYGGDPYRAGRSDEDDLFDEDVDENDYGEYGRTENRGDAEDEDERPAGIARAKREREHLRDEEPEPATPVKEWLTLGLQGGTALLAGAGVWVGFRYLWYLMPWAALLAALVVTGLLVFVARRYLGPSTGPVSDVDDPDEPTDSDDSQTILLAVLVGLMCTVSPAALLLVGH